MSITLVNGLIVYEWTGHYWTAGADVRTGIHLGKHYQSRVLHAEAAAWDADADSLEVGKTVEEAQAAAKQARHDVLRSGFAEVVQPTFAKAAPEGDPLTDPARRKARVDLSRGLARGLRKHRWFSQ